MQFGSLSGDSMYVSTEFTARPVMEIIFCIRIVDACFCLTLFHNTALVFTYELVLCNAIIGGRACSNI